MERPGFASDAKLPGFDRLEQLAKEPPRDTTSQETARQYTEGNHRAYLENKAFHQYLKMHKVLPGISGAKELCVLGRELEDEYMPTYVDAAAWAYAEAGLADTSLSTYERVQLVSRAEDLWVRAAQTQLDLQAGEYGADFYEPSTVYRYALPLAFSPLMKSIIVGDVTSEVQGRAFVDTVSFAAAVSQEIAYHKEVGNIAAKSMLVGLSHELNALSTLLYMDDPRFIPMPSTARADTGYYHPEQTHDITIFNQHWGTIRGVIPIEIKSKASARDRRRYKSLLIRGKMHLAVSSADPTETTASYEHFLDGTATEQDIIGIDRIAAGMREMLRLYKQGVTPESLSVNSFTRFRESTSLARAHPEIAP